MNKNLIADTAVLKIHTADNDDYSAEYDEYTLSNVRVVEREASEPDMTSKSKAYVYFFFAESRCTDENGSSVILPRPSYGDMCVIRAGQEDECEMRVSSAEYHHGTNAAAGLSHVKITLE